MKIKKIVLLLCSFLLTLLISSVSSAQTALPNADYVKALDTADRFLYAWKNRDKETGLSLLSPELKTKEMASYILGTSSPSHTAFEIGKGKLLPDGRYSFPANLYDYYYPHPPEKLSWKCPTKTEIIVARYGETGDRFKMGNWLVDQVPEPCDLNFID